MRAGVVTPFDLIRHMGVAGETVRTWRRRAGIRTAAARKAHVEALFRPRSVPTRPEADDAPF